MIELIVGRFVKAVETLAHDDVTGRAGAVEFTGMLNLHAVGKQRPGKVGAGFSFKGLAFRAELSVGENSDLWHLSFLWDQEKFNWKYQEPEGFSSNNASLTLRPANAARMERSIRRSAKASVPFDKASTAL